MRDVTLTLSHIQSMCFIDLKIQQFYYCLLLIFGFLTLSFPSQRYVLFLQHELSCPLQHMFKLPPPMKSLCKHMYMQVLGFCIQRFVFMQSYISFYDSNWALNLKCVATELTLNVKPDQTGQSGTWIWRGHSNGIPINSEKCQLYGNRSWRLD